MSMKYGASFHLQNQRTALNSANHMFSWYESSLSVRATRLAPNEFEPLLFPWFTLGVHSNQFEPWKPSDT